MKTVSKTGTLPLAKINKQKLSETWLSSLKKLLTMEPLRDLKKSYKITEWKMNLKKHDKIIYIFPNKISELRY